MSLKTQIQDQVKTAMRAGNKPRLATLRLISAAIKQREVDERKDVDDAEVLAILDKMAKQRRESIEQFDKAGRDDLSDVEKAELEIIAEFLPEPLSEEELQQMVNEAIEASGATGMQQMGQVMGQLQPKLKGRADMRVVSAKVRDALQSGGAA